MAKYRLKFPDDEDRFEELARISHNLRYYSKIWKEHYGSTNFRNMVRWQNEMDSWLKENVDYSDLSHLEADLNLVNGNWAYDTTFEK